MASKEYVQGMIIGAELVISECYWFQFIKRSRAQGVILACKMILENK